MLIRKLRLQRGWSQDQLAELTGLSVRTIQRLEAGQKPGLESSKALAAVFEVNVQSFTEDTTMQNAVDNTVENNTADRPANTHQSATATLAEDEKQALAYSKRVKEFYEALASWLVIGVVFFTLMGLEPVLLWVMLGTGLALAIQGLLAFEIVRLPTISLERYLAERKLGRKL